MAVPSEELRIGAPITVTLPGEVAEVGAQPVTHDSRRRITQAVASELGAPTELYIIMAAEIRLIEASQQRAAD